jgi:hypothetical protein
VKNDSLEVPSGRRRHRHRHREVLAPDEPDETSARSSRRIKKDAEKKATRRSPQAFGVHQESRRSSASKLTDEDGKKLDVDRSQEHRSCEQAATQIRLEDLDIRSPQRKADASRSSTSTCGRRSKTRSTNATASSTA